jgi:hypothetical protein
MSTPPRPAGEAHPGTAVPPSTIGLPRMTDDELALLRGVFASGRSRYAEFGAGGSTLLAVEAGFETIVTVESDAAWASAVREHALVAPAVAAGRANILHADLGPVGAWGYPQDRSLSDRFPSYIAVMWEEWDRRGAFPDLVLVDGRFRVACALSVALLAATRQPPAVPPLLLLHDMVKSRPQYLKALPFFRELDRRGTLLLLEPDPAASAGLALATMLRSLSDQS